MQPSTSVSAAQKKVGPLQDAHGLVQRGAPPSVYAVAGLVSGVPGSGARVAGLTLLRAAAMTPGVWLGAKVTPGARLGILQSVAVSVFASASLTAALVAIYGFRQARQRFTAAAQQVLDAGKQAAGMQGVGAQGAGAGDRGVVVDVDFSEG